MWKVRFPLAACYARAGFAPAAFILRVRAISISGARMTARSIRRAVARKQEKLARKSARQNAFTTEAVAAPDLDSTGPKTLAGQAKASLNALKTGLTGRTVLLPTEDVAEYERNIAMYEEEFRPRGAQECNLVESIAAITWRLGRIPALEMAIFAKGRIEFAGQFEEHEPSLRPSLIELHTFMVYETQLRNLQLQEARLARRREKETAELRQLQQERKQRETHELDSAAKLYLAARHDGKPFDPTAHGFEFSTQDIEGFLERHNLGAAHQNRAASARSAR
jgi:hypothetical protein